MKQAGFHGLFHFPSYLPHTAGTSLVAVLSVPGCPLLRLRDLFGQSVRLKKNKNKKAPLKTVTVKGNGNKSAPSRKRVVSSSAGLLLFWQDKKDTQK